MKDQNNLLKDLIDLPAFVATGGEIVFVSDDFLKVHLKFNLTENYHGTGFGQDFYYLNKLSLR